MWCFFLIQDHVKEKLKLVQDFLHVDAQDQLTSLEEKMKSSEISMVCDSLTYRNHHWLLKCTALYSPCDVFNVFHARSTGGVHL